MYVKLKEELRTIEFIKKYFSNIYINKPEMVHSYESNHFMLNLRPIIKSKGPIEEVVRLEDCKYLSDIFLDKDTENYKLIIHSLTCSSANREYDYEIYEFLGDAIIALLVRFEAVLFNKNKSEDDLDLIRLKNESNKFFYNINKEQKIYEYMIGSIEKFTTLFVPPLFQRNEFSTILHLQKNEMSNKLQFFKSTKYSYISETNKIKDLLFADKDHPDEEINPEKLKERKFCLKKDKRSFSVKNKGEKVYESCTEKLYRKTTHCQYNIESLKMAIKSLITQDIEEEMMKEYKIKQFADVIESLTASVFLKSGLQGAQIYLKELTILNKEIDYKKQFLSLANEIEGLLYNEYNTNPSIKKVEEILKYTFTYKKLLVIALTHSSYCAKECIKSKGLFSTYENLEFLGDAVHKFFIVKRLKERFDQQQMKNKENIFERDTESIIEQLNRQKSVAEKNELLGLICIQSGIYEAILHDTQNKNSIKEYAKLVKEEEKEIIKESEDDKIEYPIKLNKTYTQYHFKMLADVIEALIGAVFLDCFILKENEEEDKEDADEEKDDIKEENQYKKRKFNYNHIFETEVVWKNLVEKYLIYYADNPTLPDIALFKNDINKKPYCKDFKDNHSITMEEYTYEQIVNICKDQTITNAKEMLKNVRVNEVRYLYTFKLKCSKQMKTIFAKIYDQGYKK